MRVLIKSLFHNLFKKPLKSIAVIFSSLLMTAVVILCFSFPQVLNVNSSMWAKRNAEDSDGTITALYSQDVYDKVDSYLKEKEEADEIDSYYMSAYRSNIFTIGDITFSAHTFVMLNSDVPQALEKIGAKELKTTDVESDAINTYTSLEAAQLLDLDIGSTFTYSDHDFIIRSIYDNTSIFYQMGSMPFVFDKPYSTFSNVWKWQAFIFFNENTDTKEMNKELGALTSLGTNIQIAMNTSGEQVAESVSNAMKILITACLVICALMVVVLFFSFRVIAQNRKEDIIRFKAIGATPFQCSASIALEGLIYSIFGGLIGLGIGTLLCKFVQSLFNQKIVTFVLEIKPWYYAVAICAAVIVSLLASLPSSYQIASKSPHALRTSDEQKRADVHPIIAALAFIFFIGASIFMGIASGDLDFISIIVFIVASVILVVTMMPVIFQIGAFIINKLTHKGSKKIAVAHLRFEASLPNLTTITVLISGILWGASMMLNVVSDTAISSNANVQCDYVMLKSNQNIDQLEAKVNDIKEQGYVDDAIVKEAVSFITDETYSIEGIKDSSALDWVTLDVDIDKVKEDFDNIEDATIVCYNLARRFNLEVDKTYTLFADVHPFTCTIVGIDYGPTSYDYRFVTKYSYLRNQILNLDHGKLIMIRAPEENLHNLVEANPDTIIIPRDLYYPQTANDLNTDELLNTLEIIVYAVAGLALVNLTISISLRRKKPYMSYKLLGMTNRQVFHCQFLEAFFISAVASMFSFLLIVAINPIGAGFAFILNRYIYFPPVHYKMLLIALLYTFILFVTYLLTNYLQIKFSKRLDVAENSDYRN